MGKIQEATRLAEKLVRGSILEQAAARFIAQVVEHIYEEEIGPRDARVRELEQRLAELEYASRWTLNLIDAAGLHNLSNGVQVGPTAWFVKASDATRALREALPTTTKEPQE